MTKKRILHTYMLLLQMLNHMKSIFYARGHGLTEYEMESKEYEVCIFIHKLIVPCQQSVHETY